MDYVAKERTAAIVRAAIGAAAIILGMFGMTVDTEAWATVIMEVISIGALVYTWFWKDNNLTEERIQKEKFMDIMEEENPVEFEVVEESEDVEEEE